MLNATLLVNSRSNKRKNRISIEESLLKYDGRPIFPEEIVEKVNSILKKPKEVRCLHLQIWQLRTFQTGVPVAGT